MTFTAAGGASVARKRAPAGRDIVAIGRTRGLSRADLLMNRAAPPIAIDPTDGTVTLDDRELAIDPVDEVPLSRRYFLR